MQKANQNSATAEFIKFYPSKWCTCCACIAIICIHVHVYVVIYLWRHTHTHRDEWPCARILYTWGCYIHIRSNGYTVSTQVYRKPWIIHAVAMRKWVIHRNLNHDLTHVYRFAANEYNRTYFYVSCFNFIFFSASFWAFILVIAIDSNERANFFFSQHKFCMNKWNHISLLSTVYASR